MPQVEDATPSSETSKRKVLPSTSGFSRGAETMGLVSRRNPREGEADGEGGEKKREKGKIICMWYVHMEVQGQPQGLFFRRHPSWFFETGILSGLQLTK